MRSLFRWLLILAVLACWPAGQAAACLCQRVSPEREITSSEAIFLASVREVVGETAVLDVHLVWKGKVGASITMTQEKHRCSWIFVRGVPAMVFAYRDGASLTAGYCTMLAYEDRPASFEVYLSKMKRNSPMADNAAPGHIPTRPQ